MVGLLKISFFTGEPEVETRIAIPAASFSIAEKLLPGKLKAFMTKEEIDSLYLADLDEARTYTGTLIEIENANERMIIRME